MRNKAVVICGSAFGDEGKGKLTDYFCHQNPEAINVRFNGGAQAGHRVITPDGRQHVFSHFGAGTFVGNSTYLSEFFVVNPMLFRTEREDFVEEFGISPKVTIDLSAKVTTPYETMVNQIIEMNRQKDSSNHGSVGVGFGETLEREEQVGITLDMFSVFKSYYDNNNFGMIREILRQIQTEFLPVRLGFTLDEFDSNFDVEQLTEDFIGDCLYLLEHADVGNVHSLKGKDLVFEGAQGLLLDQTYGHFPYVTRSNCGMKNVMEILTNLGEYNIDIVYVTRAYSTRHGAGPLYNEDPEFKRTLVNIEQETNVSNQFQQHFRYAPFDWEQYNMVTSKDVILHAPRDAKMIRAMTCLDQISDATLREIKRFGNLDKFDLTSNGPTREDVL